MVNRRSASKGLDEALGRGRKAVERLTVLIKKELRNDPTTVGAWMQLRRLPRVNGKAAARAAAPVSANAPVSPAVTAPVQEVQAA